MKKDTHSAVPALQRIVPSKPTSSELLSKELKLLLWPHVSEINARYISCFHSAHHIVSLSHGAIDMRLAC